MAEVVEIPRDERGASSVEYGLLIVGIAAVLVLAVFGLGALTSSMFNTTCKEVGTAIQSTKSC